MNEPPGPLAITLILTTVCLAILFIGIAVWFRRTTYYRWAQLPFLLVNVFYTHFIWRASYNRRLPVEYGQGAVIVCNHSFPMDPSFIQMTTNRTVHWMVAREYSKHPAMGWIFRILGAIPVNRGGVDTAATRMAMRYVEDGELIGLFPEGRINTTSDLLLPGRPGAALIALKAACPVIPCYIEGAPYDGTAYGCFFMTARVRLFIGDPIDTAPYCEMYSREGGEKEAMAALTLRMLQEIATLAGHPEFEPQMAGRRWLPSGEEQESA